MVRMALNACVCIEFLKRSLERFLLCVSLSTPLDRALHLGSTIVFVCVCNVFRCMSVRVWVSNSKVYYVYAAPYQEMVQHGERRMIV